MKLTETQLRRSIRRVILENVSQFTPEQRDLLDKEIEKLKASQSYLERWPKASDESELVKMINTSVDINDKPSAIRYPRGTGIGLELPSIDEKIEIGKGRIIQKGKQVCIISLGTRLEECKLAAEELKNRGITTTIVDARFVKPLDQDLILKCAREHELMITIEEGSIGGFGSHVKNLLAEKGIFDKGLKFRSMTLPDVFIEQNDPKKMYELAGLNASQISKKILDVLYAKDTIKVVKNL